MDRFEAMSVFLAAAESGSLSKASRNLRLPLATVSRKVAELETHLNTTLVIRSAKGLELTPAGRSYVTSAKAILEQVTEAERAAAGEYVEPKGDLVVTAPVMFGRMQLLPIVNAFLAAYPNVAVNLVLTDHVAHFLDDQVDVALRIGYLADSSLVATRVGGVQHIVCASPAYLAAHGAPDTLDDLKQHEAVHFQSLSAAASWAFEQNGQSVTATFHSRLSVNSIDAAIEAAVAGAGIVRAVSYQITEHVRAKRLVPILRGLEPAPRPVHLVYDARSRLPLKLRAFIDFAVPRLREQLTEAVI